MQNWQLMLGGMPYSEAFARPSPLLHLWSLSVEGQLYVLWPLLFVGVLAVQRRASVVVVALGLAVVSAVVLAVGYTPDGGELIYYATPARASGFLVGAALAVAWRPEAWSRPLPRVVDAVLDCAGLVAVVTVVLAFVTASEFDAALFDRGGFLRTGLASAVVILAATPAGDRRHPCSPGPCSAAPDGARTGSTSTTGRCSCSAATSRSRSGCASRCASR